MAIKDLNKKFWAYFHDPDNKAFVLSEGISHEEKAKEFSDILKIQQEEFKTANIISSSVDRLSIPKGNEKYTKVKIDFNEDPIFIHPLSGTKSKLNIIDNTKLEKIIKDTLKFFSEIPHEGNSTDELFFLLWEFFEDKLKEKVNRELISKLPADTRIPDHSIWDHLSSSSAIASSYPDPAFLIFSISPVQSFISTAKKTRDFWLGSYILSYLAWCGIEKVIEKFGPDSIIFPDLNRQPFFRYYLKENYIENNQITENKFKKFIDFDLSIPSIPNRFLALVSYSEGKELLKEIEKNITQEFKAISEKILEKLEKKIEIDAIFKDIFDRQIKNFFCLSGVVLPWSFKSNKGELSYDNTKKNIKDFFGDEYFKEYFNFLERIKGKIEFSLNPGVLYQVLYNAAERFSASQKSQRLINVKKSEKGFKCTLCGERESLHNEGNTSWNELSKFWNDISEKYPIIIDKSEKLCGICLTKRLSGEYFKDKYRISETFPSTSDIATIPFKLEVLKNGEIEGLSEFVLAVKEAKPKYLIKDTGKINNNFKSDNEKNENLKYFLELPGQFFYREFYDKDKKELQELFKKPDKISNIKNKFNDFIKKTNERNIKKPSKYYSLIKFDGDKMGEILNGKLNIKLKNAYHPKAKEIIKKKYKDFYSIIENSNKPLSISLHRTISRALRNFALEFVKYAVEDIGKGKVIFAGGDDVFAMLPLENFFESINLLRAFYSGEVKTENNGEFKVDYDNKKDGWIEKDGDHFITLGNRATASLGASIVHYEEPLSRAIKLADKAEKKAKKSGRNAFCIKFKRRSGEIRESCFNWFYEIDNSIERVDFIKEIVEQLSNKIKDDKLSPNFIQSLKLEFFKMLSDFDNNNEDDKELKEMFLQEFSRLLSRSLKNSSHEDKKIFIKEIKEKLEKISNFKKNDSNLWTYIDPYRSIKNIIFLFEIIFFVAKGGESV